MTRRQRCVIFVQLVGVPAGLFGALYMKASDSVPSQGTNLLVALIAWGIYMAIFSSVLIAHKYRGGQFDWQKLAGPRDPSDNQYPPGWWFDEKARRWRRPPRKSS